MGFVEIFIILVIFCPLPYIYLYLYLVDPSSDADCYDVYYTLHGRKQKKPVNDCSKCLSAVTPDAQVIDPQCIGVDYKCSIKLGLKSVLRGFDFMNNNIDEYGSKYRRNYANDITLIRVNSLPDDENSGNLYGVSSLHDFEYDYLMGEWRLSSIIHNDNNVWTKYDKYRRHLKLFLYDNNDSKRWIVGHNLSSDAAYIYSPLNEYTSAKRRANPINIIHDEWLYHNASIKQWKKLVDFRFSPSSSVKPQLQAISIANKTLLDVDVDTVIYFTFTHFIALSELGSIVIYLNNDVYQVITGADRAIYVDISSDKLMLSNLTLPHACTFSISLSANLVHSVDSTRRPRNGNNEYVNAVSFETRSLRINWNSVAAQYLSLAVDILNKSREMEKNEVVEMNLFISFLKSVLFIDSHDVHLFATNIREMSGYLSAKKQEIMNRNESLNYQLLKSNYYLKLSQLNLLKGYHHLLNTGAVDDDGETAKKYIDKSLRICIKQYYGSAAGKKYAYVDGVIAANQYNHYYCNFHTYDTYAYLLNNHNDYYDISYFISTIKLRWIVREYTFRYYDDLSILFGSTSSRIGLIVDNLQNRIEFESSPPPRYDILFGLRNLYTIRLQLARYGVVQVKNLLNLIECKWLANNYALQHLYRSTNDRISYVYLQDLAEIMSYLVGHNVKKSYSMFVDFNNTNFYVNNIAQTLREDNTYTILLTINQRQNPQYPFPIYLHKQVLPAQKNKFHQTNYKENYEIINNIGDAIIFKGTQHIHFAPYTRTVQSHYYWAILFHFVDLDYDFVDYKKRFQLNNGAI